MIDELLLKFCYGGEITPHVPGHAYIPIEIFWEPNLKTSKKFKILNISLQYP